MRDARRGGPSGPLLRLACLGAVIVIGSGWNSVALAHAERSASDPEADARLRSVPTEVVIDFTEPPIQGASVAVVDGCERDVVEDVEVSGTTMTIPLQEGRPGDWTVEFRVVSAIDGHPTRDSFDFRVRGAPDCEDLAAPEPDDGEEPRGGDGGGLPVVPIALGVSALLAAAIAARVMSSR